MSIKRKQWVQRMRTWQDSGLSRTAFCRAQGIAVGTFDYWRRVLGVAAARQALVPVVVKPPVTAVRVAVVLPNGIRLELESGVEPAQVRTLAEALRSC